MYFDRAKYKDFSKKQLSGRWGIPILVSIVSFLIISLFAIPDVIRLVTNDGLSQFLTADYSSFQEYLESYNTLMGEVTSTVSSFVQSFVEVIFIMAALNVYLQMSRSPEKVKFSAFVEGLNNWWRAILCYLYKSVMLFLWFLCFFIPGIIKAFAYSQMEYLIAEFPNLSITKAMDISKKITNGNKWHLFVMELSFIGWAILCCLSCGIGFLWLKPYKTMSYINAYHAMLKDALENGLIKPEDLQ